MTLTLPNDLIRVILGSQATLLVYLLRKVLNLTWKLGKQVDKQTCWFKSPLDDDVLLKKQIHVHSIDVLLLPLLKSTLNFLGILQVPPGQFHKVHTVSEEPSCYMYIYINTTYVEIMEKVETVEKTMSEKNISAGELILLQWV